MRTNCRVCFSLPAGRQPGRSGRPTMGLSASFARRSALAFRGAANPGCRPAFSQPLEIGHLCQNGGPKPAPPPDWRVASVGRALARRWPAFSRPPCFETNFPGLVTSCLRDEKPEKIPAKCVNGLFRFDGGLKGRLQARLPAPSGGRLHAMNRQSRTASFFRLDKLKHVVPEGPRQDGLPHKASQC